MHGTRPVVRGFSNWPAELATQVRQWRDADIEAGAIGIAARTGTKAKDIRAAQQDAGIANATRPQADAVQGRHGAPDEGYGVLVPRRRRCRCRHRATARGRNVAGCGRHCSRPGYPARTLSAVRRVHPSKGLPVGVVFRNPSEFLH